MPAYIVVEVDVHDMERYSKYKDMAPPSIYQYGGKYIARGGTCEPLEGNWTPPRFVILEFPDASELLDKVGVRMQVVKSAEHKDTGSPFRPITEEDRAVLDSLVRDVYRQFVEVVAEERSLDATSLGRVADGRVLSGRQALESGLIDRIGNVHDALASAGVMAGTGSFGWMTSTALGSPGAMTTRAPTLLMFQSLTANWCGRRMHPCEAG